MVRLTGRHPFNSEPIPKRLFDSFITPPSLHYVRNHGAVPKVRSGAARKPARQLQPGSSLYVQRHQY